MTVETLALRCTSCGASLAIPTGPAHVTCTFCGTALMVVKQGGVAFLERDVEVIREGVAHLRTGVDALLDGQDDVHRRLARIERAARGQIITAEMEEIEKAGKTPLSVFALIGGAILCGGLAFGVREGRNAGPSHPLLFLALPAAVFVLIAAVRWPASRRYAALRRERARIEADSAHDPSRGATA